MADISKIKLANGTTVNIKDTAARADIATAQGAIAAETTRAQGEEARIEGLVSAEKSRAEGAEGGLDTRIKALESKGRFLSTWNAETGKPDTYPELSQLVEGKYNYRSGDYYIVNKVTTSNLMPDGAYISYDSATTTWTVPTKAFTGTLNLGDQFQYDGTKWVHIASATTVAFANIQGDAEDNTNLKGKLDAKVREITTGDANGQIKYRNTADGTYTNVDVKGLEDLAYAETASGPYTPAGTVNVTSDAIKGGTVSVTLDQTATTVNLSDKVAYTPAGSVSKVAKAAGDVDVLTGGSINVTVKDAATATEAALTTSKYTPTGTVAAVEGGNFSALKTATFGENSTDGVQISGTVSKPDVDLTSTEKTFATGLTGGSVASFDTTKFHGGQAASLSTGFYTAGSDASLSAGAQASLTAQSKSKFASKMPKATVGTGTDAETLMFVYVDSTDTELTANFSDAVTDRGTFTANTLQELTGGKATVIDTAKFNGGTAASIDDGIFTANVLQGVSTDKVNNITAAALKNAPVFTGNKYAVSTTSDTALKEVAFTATNSADVVTKATYLKQEIDAKTFTPTEAGIKFTGTESANLIPTKVTYDKASVKSASLTGEAAAVSATFAGTAATITVSPDA